MDFKSGNIKFEVAVVYIRAIFVNPHQEWFFSFHVYTYITNIASVTRDCRTGEAKSGSLVMKFLFTENSYNATSSHWFIARGFLMP
jgi:hypothetical protein